MLMRLIVVVLCVLAISACAAGQEIRDTPPATTDDTPMRSEDPPPAASLTLSSVQPSRAPSEPAGDELTGVLGADSIEGGCGYLQASDGTRYEVIYPDGWRLDLDPLQLTSPDGEIVARGGDEVTVQGTENASMASICQIGPIFRATDVVISQ